MQGCTDRQWEQQSGLQGHACIATRSLGSSNRQATARRLTTAFSASGTRDHSLLPRVFRQELPTAFLATTAASILDSCKQTVASARRFWGYGAILSHRSRQVSKSP